MIKESVMPDEASLKTDKQILFVDDEKSLALLGADLLDDLGYSITCAFDGETALQLFQQKFNDVDLVITDESMPGMSGIELAQEIFSLSPSIPVILCSGHMLTMGEEGMDKANIVAVLAKTEVYTQLPGMIKSIFSAG